MGSKTFPQTHSEKTTERLMIGNPYSGKPNVRFDEGELEIGHGQAIEALPDERGRNR